MSCGAQRLLPGVETVARTPLVLLLLQAMLLVNFALHFPSFEGAPFYPDEIVEIPSTPTGSRQRTRAVFISIGLSPIDLVEYKSAHALAAQKRQLTTQQTSVEEQWFSPILVSNAVVNSRTCLPSDAEALKGGAGQGDTGSMGWQGKRSPVVVRSSQTSERKSAGLAPVVQCAEASKGHNSAAGTPAPSSEPSAPLVLPEHDGGGDREQAASNGQQRRKIRLEA